jgi:hypothetical protein
MPLNASHKTLGCDSCHKNGLFTGANVTCNSCHVKDYQAAKTPDHKAAGFPTNCELCHRPADATFTQGRFDHNQSFRLVGAHATTDCASCHRNGVFRGTPRDCVGCHRQTFEKTTNPNHVTSGFSTDCALCHRPTDPTFGSGGNFNHNSVFQLVGTHSTAACASCHKNNVFTGTPRDCIGCHRQDFDRTTTPNHAASGFSTDCTSCHRPTDPTFRSGNFNHNSVFQLVGTHATQACATCHVNNVFKGTPRDCVGCHRDDYQRTTTPNHAASGFSTTCDSCHRPTDSSWRGAGTFNHNSVFQLVGNHATQACATCHVNNVFKGTPRDCVGCHRDDYQRTTTPNHAASGFSTTCDSCHRPTDPSWRGAGTFNHNSVFQLVGNHATQACATCHVNNVFKGTPRDCAGCHRDEYQRTTAPNHAASGFSTTCDSCHRPTDPSWRGGAFDHNSVFQLLGKHATTVCGVCHTNNVYKGTPRDCVGCHKSEYDRTASPSHVAARFPTTCETCHRGGDSAWTQGRFTHTWFPITSGKHSGNPCSACHTNPNNYVEFTCLTCHTRTQTDSEHRGRAGYAYDSNRCYACHPTGRGD